VAYPVMVIPSDYSVISQSQKRRRCGQCRQPITEEEWSASAYHRRGADSVIPSNCSVISQSQERIDQSQPIGGEERSASANHRRGEERSASTYHRRGADRVIPSNCSVISQSQERAVSVSQSQERSGQRHNQRLQRHQPITGEERSASANHRRGEELSASSNHRRGAVIVITSDCSAISQSQERRSSQCQLITGEERSGQCQPIIGEVRRGQRHTPIIRHWRPDLPMPLPQTTPRWRV
jgi:hypothetical protein